MEEIRKRLEAGESIPLSDGQYAKLCQNDVVIVLKNTLPCAANVLKITTLDEFIQTINSTPNCS